jgi:uncharacterized SAM-dependent methyltransferase
MASGIFCDFTEAEVLAIRSAAKTLVTEGKTLMSWGSGNTTTGKQFVMPVKEVLEECRYALRKIDPDTYGALVMRATCNFNSR